MDSRQPIQSAFLPRPLPLRGGGPATILCWALVVTLACLPGPTVLYSDEEPETELHLVAIYGGTPRAPVRVDRPGKSVVLFLCSHEPVYWNVEVTADTQVREVIVGGREEQLVEGLDQSVKVTNAFGDGDTALVGYYRIGSQKTRRLITTLAKRTGLVPSSFHGIYRPKETIAVDSVQIDARLDPRFPRVSTKTFPETVFPAAHVVAGQHRKNYSVGSYSLQGPKVETLKPVDGQYQSMAYDPDSDQWYGLSNALFKLEGNGTSATELRLDLRLPRFSHPRGVTFDTKRKRVLIATMGGKGKLYAYSVPDQRWSVVCSLNGLDLSNLCYFPHDDCLYSLHLDYDGNSNTIPTMLKLNSNGAAIESRRLGGPPMAGIISDGHRGGSAQLYPFGEKLALVASSDRVDSYDGTPLESTTYVLLVDPSTMHAELTWKSGHKSNTTAPEREPTDKPTKPETPPTHGEVVVPPEQLPTLRFRAPYAAVASRHSRSGVSWGEFTQSGPKLGSLRPLPDEVRRLAYDPEKKQHYGLGNHSVFQVDMNLKTATRMDVGGNVERMVWPSAMTFDSTRRRLLVFARNKIYACDVDKDHKWSIAAKFDRGNQVLAAAYSPKEDAVFAISYLNTAGRHFTLVRFDADGVMSVVFPLTTALSERIGRGPGSSSHLIAIKDRLVLLVYPWEHRSNQERSESYMYLLDPKTQKVQLTWRTQTQ